MDGTDAIPLLKGLRIGILKEQGRDDSAQWTRDNSFPHLSDLFAKEYLATYSKTGIKLLIDIESFWQKMAILQTFSAVHEGVHDKVTVHPYLHEIMGAVQERESVARRWKTAKHWWERKGRTRKGEKEKGGKRKHGSGTRWEGEGQTMKSEAE